MRYPIQMEVSKTREKAKHEDAGDDYKPEYETYTETDTINSMIPIWKRKKSDVTDGGTTPSTRRTSTISPTLRAPSRCMPRAR